MGRHDVGSAVLLASVGRVELLLAVCVERPLADGRQDALQ